MYRSASCSAALARVSGNWILRSSRLSPVIVGCGGTVCGSELPACRAIRLCGRDAEHGVGGHAIDLPWRRPGAGRVVGRDDPVPADLSRPAALPPDGGDCLERRAVGDPLGQALEDQVDAGQARRERARRVDLEVAGLAGLLPGLEIDVAVVPG